MLSGTKMSIMALICSICAFICYMISTSMCTERVKIEKKTETFSFATLMNQLFSSRSLLSLIVAMIVLLLSQLTMGNMAAYVFPNYFGNVAAQSVATLGGSVITVVLSLFVIQPMSKNMAKRKSQSSEILLRPLRILFCSEFIQPA